jgi:hypothetical protein
MVYNNDRQSVVPKTDDTVKIRNIILISLAVLLIIFIVCYFLPELDFYAVAASGTVVFVLFIATLLFYLKASREKNSKRLKYILFSFVLKIVVSALMFYLVYEFKFVNIMTYLISFLIFFTVFFNAEIFLIYKKVLYFNR